ncbi:MAG: ATP-binding protein [Gammaproteobacteria bacterium]|nr:DUF4143 domain-containing protein [Gammaproteobacteria bacterium]MXX05969.1 ATP-binding protein [Gammaproteobacteria bacterium]MXY90126.1 ATP-binding protein [Gammaproteobacteria bacterium]MXZ32526.1 ATP-binding protein [Gammaproteobacteria bacterium]MYA35160.1 ATP-binding protein [Gammaproteobacteria bacterium]
MKSDSNGYMPRLADKELATRLARASTVLIEGPKACGKTATAKRMARSEVCFDVDANARQAVSIDPQPLLEGDTPRLFDEWQIVPEIWNHVRRASDQRSGKGKFILTGSAAPTDDIVRHSGAGRISRLRMRTMSLFEQDHANGKVSLGDLLSGATISATDPGLTISDIVELICRGGWPGTIGDSLNQAMGFARDYIDELRRTDVGSVEGVRHDPAKVLRLMQSLARNIATEVKLTTLARDVSGTGENVQARTVAGYMEALRKLFVVEELPPFSPHLRSKSRLLQAAKQQFADPSVAVAAIRSNPGQLRADLEYLGFLFESMVVRDLRIYAAPHDAELSHYRDNTGLEVDAVIQTAAGAWLPVEVKLGNSESIIDAAASTLLKFKSRVDTAKMGEPANLLLVTATGYAYRRPDGVTVAPIGSLGP